MVSSRLFGVDVNNSDAIANSDNERGGGGGGDGGTGEGGGGRGAGVVGSAISPNSGQSYRRVDGDGDNDDDNVNGANENNRNRNDGGNSSSGNVNGSTAATSALSEWNRNSGPPLLSMSVDLHNLVSSNNQQQDSGHYSASPERTHNNSVVSGGCTVKINHDEEESYEGFGSIEGDADDGVDSPGGSSEAPSPTGTSGHLFRNPRSPSSTIGRHSWLRTSLRRTPPSSGRKRLSSNALASQLYRSGSFNSSGRGSTCDATEDMYNMFLEDDVIDLDHRVQMIQEQMHALADTQSVGEERYARVKQENATLQARILMLEETAKDAEARADERLQAEQRRHREWACHLERERQLQLENCAIKLQAAELESSSLRDEIGRLREQLEKVKNENARLEGDLEEATREAVVARESERQALSRGNEINHLLDTAREELSIRLEDQQRIEELEQQIAHLRSRNKNLEETRDELQAAAALQAGRELLMLNPCNNGTTEKGCSSLAVELLAGMNQDQTGGHLSTDYDEPCSISEVKQALKEQQEVNAQLKAYIDGILLNIVENYPQLLEVKQTH